MLIHGDMDYVMFMDDVFLVFGDIVPVVNPLSRKRMPKPIMTMTASDLL